MTDTDTFLDEITWNEDGLVPAIAQDASSGDILMMAWMNRESLSLTAKEGVAVYWSRSRQQLWRKGETSGHTQKISAIKLDCDADALILSIEQIGGIACHTGRRSCFYRTLTDGRWQENSTVLKDPKEMYS
ncbi:phosphoribosyl-AMP cyclohydrolase [Teredinibacter purpureus]|jgi:phosphoribosyl-AMP cyclohydrolase (EC 3.5.4.19)|uniref:phosphoribosyl-AMP cyclohydrolase n=1 Tax=Teredinibacter purpureus TaxID=2731756 RepID=UPI0005F8811A|nr:phosphoribosyl-AMP cyclohydrolase [Teredinibacter purpureus]